MRENETLRDYTNRFINLLREAGYQKDDPQMAEKYRASLLSRNQTLVTTILGSKHVPNGYRWTVSEIFEAAKPVYDDQELVAATTGSKRKGDTAGINGRMDNGRKKVIPTNGSAGFFCARHGGDKANHNEDQRYSRKSYLGSRNVPAKATGGNRTCAYCHRPWSHGHYCQAYLEHKRKIH
ncbi:MAG: hypothetical protein EXX96DRAFT_510009, partial [Benjaminiella poitrasii]